ncbi:hypothetical protein [uncultured Flavobacterium sp.]|uniref:hypothetical protein n=1 Tax=uncultured Flavobacterium sp. TaxID=165435 RepID=UPI0025F0D34F|nr:hypothetical protein [uncultured Flavobacterium sp.]
MNHRISIPKPCHEDWSAMTPNEQGRFCRQCDKTVTDFTGMGALEIQSYLLENSGKNVCGRFKSTQLETITISIPEKVLFTQTKFRNVFILALLVTMGTTLLSCKDKSQTIGEIAIARDSVAVDTTKWERVATQTPGMTVSEDTLPVPAQSKSCGTGNGDHNINRLTGKEFHLTGAVVVDPIPPERDDIIVGEPVMPVVNPVPAKDTDSVN